MTGPIPRITCPACGGEFARRLDGAPYGHRCVDNQPRPSIIGRRRCGRCGLFLEQGPGAARCPKCQTVWETR